MISGNGKILGRKRTGASAMEQRMLAKAVKRGALHGPAAVRRSGGVTRSSRTRSEQTKPRPIGRSVRFQGTSCSALSLQPGYQSAVVLNSLVQATRLPDRC